MIIAFIKNKRNVGKNVLTGFLTYQDYNIETNVMRYETVTHFCSICVSEICVVMSECSVMSLTVNHILSPSAV